MRTCLRAVLAIAVCLLAVPAQAGHFCHHCGCERDCKKVCRLECKKKKLTKTDFAVECEDFCVPGPSKRSGYLVDEKCKGHPHRKFVWQPTCAKVYTRRKLVKKEVTEEVPDYKWLVEEYCCVCGQYIKVEDKEKPDDKKGASDKGGSNQGDPYKKSEWPPVWLSGRGRADEIRVGEGSGYYWDDPRHNATAERGWPPAINPAIPATASRFSWTNEKN